MAFAERTEVFPTQTKFSVKVGETRISSWTKKLRPLLKVLRLVLPAFAKVKVLPM